MEEKYSIKCFLNYSGIEVCLKISKNNLGLVLHELVSNNDVFCLTIEKDYC